MSPATRRAVLCSTCRQALRKGVCATHGERNADGTSRRHPSARKGETYSADVPTRAEIMAMIGACSTRAPTGVRNAAILVTFYRTGAREAELLALKPKDVDFKNKELHILQGKGKRRRTVLIDSDALAYIGRWLEVRKTLGISGHRPLFCTLKGGPVSWSYLTKLVPRLALRAGVHRRVHVHGFRHAYAVELEREGVPRSTISKLLGHSNSAVTARYLDHIGADELAQQLPDRSGWAEAA